MTFDEILASDSLIPSLPATVAELLREFQRGEPDVRRVTALLETEVGLTVRMLRLVNSAAHGRGAERIGSVEAAIALLGLAATRQLVSAAAVGGAFKGVPGLDMAEFWRFSLDVAKIAQAVAVSVGLDRGHAFTAGLLHGTGDLIMKMAMPQRPCLRPPLQTDGDRLYTQAIDLGYSYAEVGAAFAERWEFPTPIVDAIRRHGDAASGDQPDTLAGALYLACWSARAHELEFDGPALCDHYPRGVAAAIGFVDEQLICDGRPIEWTRPEEAREFA